MIDFRLRWWTREASCDNFNVKLRIMSIYHDEIEIEDMEYDEDTETYYYPCPCGDRFQITKVNRP